MSSRAVILRVGSGACIKLFDEFVYFSAFGFDVGFVVAGVLGLVLLFVVVGELVGRFGRFLVFYVEDVGGVLDGRVVGFDVDIGSVGGRVFDVFEGGDGGEFGGVFVFGCAVPAVGGPVGFGSVFDDGFGGVFLDFAGVVGVFLFFGGVCGWGWASGVLI